MQALDPCDHFHQLFDCETPSETDFSPLLASQDSSPFSAFSTTLGSTPRKLREWKPTNWELKPTDWALDPKEDPQAIPLGWRTLELSPLVQAFLPAKINPDNLTSALSKFKETEEAIDESKNSSFDTFDSRNSSFDTLNFRNSSFDMSTFSSTLNLSHPMKMHSRSQSRFHTTFQSMMSDSDSASDLDSESKPSPNGTLLTQSTMDFLFGGSIPCDVESIGDLIEKSIWETIWENGDNGENEENGDNGDNGENEENEENDPNGENDSNSDNGKTKLQARASPWDTPKSHPKLWDPFEVADSTPTPA